MSGMQMPLLSYAQCAGYYSVQEKGLAALNQWILTYH